MLCKAPDSQEEMKVSRDEFAVLSNTLNTLSRTMLEALDTEITHKDGDWRDDQPVQTLHLQPGLLVLQPGGEDLPHVSTVGLEAEPHGVSDVGDLRSPLLVPLSGDGQQAQSPRHGHVVQTCHLTPITCHASQDLTFKLSQVQLRLGDDVEDGEVDVPGDGDGVQAGVREAAERDVLQPAVNIIEVLALLEVESLAPGREAGDVQGVDD